MTELTPETIAELRRLLDAATPVPWEWGGSRARPVLRRVNRELSGCVLGCGALLGPSEEDAALIVAAVNSLPSLLAGRRGAWDAIEHMADELGWDHTPFCVGHQVCDCHKQVLDAMCVRFGYPAGAGQQP